MIRRLPILTAVLFFAACASPPQLTQEFLDPSSGATITRSVTPYLLYRNSTAFAAHARNYVQIGPIEVNRSGQFEYYLWLGVWSTMQTIDSSEHRDGFESITILVDGEPLSLELFSWTSGAIGAEQPLYVRPVSSATDAYYRVTADQIRMLAEAVDIRLRTAGQSLKEYELWDKQQSARESYRAFVEAAFF